VSLVCGDRLLGYTVMTDDDCCSNPSGAAVAVNHATVNEDEYLIITATHC